MVPEFFPLDCSSICSTSCGKVFILKVSVGFVLEGKDFKSNNYDMLWGLQNFRLLGSRERRKKRGGCLVSKLVNSLR